MEKEVRNCSTQASSSRPPIIFPNTVEQDNLTKPKRLVSNLKHLSFAANLLALANQAAEEYESLPVKTIEEEDAYEQRKRRAKRISRSNNKAQKVIEEAKGLELQTFTEEKVDETLKPLSFDDLLALGNTASVTFHRQVSPVNGTEVEEYLPHTCKQSEDRGEAGPLKVVTVTDRSGGCREDRLFEKKYVRKKRVNHNKEEHSESTSVVAVARSFNLFKKLCIHKSSSLINVDNAQREEEGLETNCETHSKSEQVGVEGQQGGCDTQIRDENQEVTEKSSLIPCILGIKIPKRVRSKRKRKPEEPKKNSDSSQGEGKEEKERASDQIDSDADAEEDSDADEPEEEEEENSRSEADIGDEETIVSELEDSLPLLEDAETEEEEEDEDVSDATSCNWWSFTTRPRTSKGIRNVRWRNKKKRNCITLEERQSNRKILLLAVEAITHQLGLLDISIKEKKSS